MIDKNYFHFENDILWSLRCSNIGHQRKVFDGKSYFPHRTIVPEKNLVDEILAQDFELLMSTVVKSEGEPDNFAGLFRYLN